MVDMIKLLNMVVVLCNSGCDDCNDHIVNVSGIRDNANGIDSNY